MSKQAAMKIEVEVSGSDRLRVIVKNERNSLAAMIDATNAAAARFGVDAESVRRYATVADSYYNGAHYFVFGGFPVPAPVKAKKAQKLTKAQKAIEASRAAFDAQVERAMAQFPNATFVGMALALGGAMAAPMRATATVDGWIVFSNGQFGDHRVSLDCSTAERVLAHWSGYLENNARFGPNSFAFGKVA